MEIRLTSDHPLEVSFIPIADLQPPSGVSSLNSNRAVRRRGSIDSEGSGLPASPSLRFNRKPRTDSSVSDDPYVEVISCVITPTKTGCRMRKTMMKRTWKSRPPSKRWDEIKWHRNQALIG